MSDETVTLSGWTKSDVHSRGHKKPWTLPESDFADSPQPLPVANKAQH